ncbi:ketopantoate reductase family protein [Flavivirga sp. 57AJ16]|uniref:ketopantoate reductase family protein n=1 Tax=Flavivirga sp. 57AJ16 TaxID=3025307 RepID=UPI002365B22C|nr:ketopantoate reductase C-terminal domain-containing protein [Flavivirga sp. 57AJ16]MDD7886212.1 2-dehydropantoate 2-reductase N-terminal domain-containing protein [Flavivirga sp. 57AJ16]
MKIGIFGLGAIGSALAVKINGEHKVYYYNRSNRDKIKILCNGVQYEKEIELSNVDTSYNLDWLIICLKEYHYKSALSDLKKLISSNTKVALVRNGINLKESIQGLVDENKVIECMIDCPVEEMGNQTYKQLNRALITSKNSHVFRDFITLFNHKSVSFNEADNYVTENWKKIIISSATGGILALIGEKSWVLKDPEILKLCAKIISEGIDVANLSGAKIEDDFLRELVEDIKSSSGSKGSSMLTDRLNGKPIEVNAKNGVISSYGKRYGVKTEINDLITVLLKHTNNEKDI